MGYITNKNSVAEAKAQGTYPSPQTLIVTEDGESRIILGDKGDDVDMPLYGETLEELTFDSPYERMNFTIEALENMTLTVERRDDFNYNKLYYKREYTDWIEIISFPINIEFFEDEKIEFKGTPLVYDEDEYEYMNGSYHFYSDYEHNVYGNLKSLIGYGEPIYTIFSGMFMNDYCLVDAANLVMPDRAPINCYAEMFRYCSELVSAPRELPALEAEYECYNYMFANCYNLINPPIIKARVFSASSCSGMFSSCEGCTIAPDLYIDKVVDGPYDLYSGPFCYMFYGSSIESAKIFVAENAKLSDYTFYDMFYGCWNLSEILCTMKNPNHLITNWWVYNVSYEGTFYKDPDADWNFEADNEYSGIPYGWEVADFERPKDYSKEYLQLQAKGGGVTLYLNNTTSYEGEVVNNLEVKINDGEWFRVYDYDSDSVESIVINDGDIAYFKGDGYYSDVHINSWDSDYWFDFEFNGSEDAYLVARGNIMSLVYGDDFIGKTTLDPIPFGDEESCPSYFGGLFAYLPIRNASNLLLANCELPCLYACMFNGCDYLVSTPELPNVTNYKLGYYLSMFGDCESLISAPYINDGIADTNAFGYMFRGCSNLYEVQEEIGVIPNSDSYNCFGEMFCNCTSLETAPEITTENTAPSSYCGMFAGCTNLRYAQITLPATTLAESCYVDMFASCESLTTAPELPATTLADYCYYGMFSGCTSLTTAPVLPATTLVEGCYCEMFLCCENLDYIKCLAEDGFESEECLEEWTNGVSSEGTFVKSEDASSWIVGISGIPEGWTVTTPKEYLTFTAVDPGATVRYNTLEGVTAQYSYDKVIWYDGEGVTVTLNNVGDKVYYKGCVLGNDYLYGGGNGFEMSSDKRISASGSIMSIYNNAPEATVINHWGAFYDMFEGCSSLTTAPELPATTLNTYCYTNMFYGCSSLTTAPELPATTLADHCYSGMFHGCSSLTSAPELPAVELTYDCYDGMFTACSSLTTAPELPATTLSTYCYAYMFSYCTSLTTAPELPATALFGYCYNNMFYGCTSLTTAPELPATTLSDYCYQYMFYGCSSLTTAPSILPATTLAYSCYYEMFRGCSSLTTAPELPATTLASNCYHLMFQGCSSLTYVAHHIIEWNEGNTSSWLSGVAQTGTVACPLDSDISIDSDSGVPIGWTKGYLPLRFTSQQNGSTITYALVGSPSITVSYSTDGSTWNNLIGTTVTLNEGESIQVKGTVSANLSESNYGKFVMTGKIAASGSIMSLQNENPSDTSINHQFEFCKLFYGCSSLTVAPELPATTLSYACYEHMFNGCSGLTTTPLLPSVNLADWCYGSMFFNCTSLTHIENLPAETLAESCYRGMFQGCTSLTTVPELPATEMSYNCYYRMFYGCSSLESVSHNITNWNASYATEWLYGVASVGAVNCPEESTIPLDSVSGVPTGWTKRKIIRMLTFTSEQNGSYVGYYLNGSPSVTVNYSRDGGKTWSSLIRQTIYLNAGDSIIVKGKISAAPSTSKYGNFSMSGKIAASGSVMSLQNEDPYDTSIKYSYEFYRLFYNCSSLTSAPELPATTLANYCYYYMFYGCTSLTSAPELPAMDLTNFCYQNMFYNCTSLTSAPELPATTLANSCYSNMFYNCTSLTSAPELPATTLAYSCYSNMFNRCSSLTTAPELPAMNLADYCYQNMFYNCTSLTSAPELPATTLAYSCYYGMFYGCSSLTTAPSILPANTLTDSCYSNMFYNCTSLTSAPELPATTLVSNCYYYMFRGCTSLSRVVHNITNWNTSHTYYWLYNVSSKGKVICPEDSTIPTSNVSGVPSGWSKLANKEILKFTSQENGSTISYALTGSPSITVSYSSDNGSTWNNLIGTTVTLNSGESIQVKGKISTAPATSKYGNFVMTGKIAASGSVMSLQNEEPGEVSITYSYEFYRLFDGCSSLTTAPELPVMTLKTYCYQSMFSGCSSLTSTPSLPATTLANNCYSSMFSDCTSLTTAPSILPATTLTSSCYYSMFNGCSSLTTAPELPATTLIASCYSSMFYGCSSLTTAPELPATKLITSCYHSMFYGCSSLTSAPELPATTLDGSCYRDMFRNCSSLTSAPELPATILAENCYSGMFQGCTSLTSAPELPATTLFRYCYRGMFQDCTSLTTAPSLPTKTLAKTCYESMFQGCTSLINPPDLPATVAIDECYRYMFKGCTSLINAPEINTTTNSSYICYQDMFEGCSSLTSVIHHVVSWSTSNAIGWLKDVSSNGVVLCPSNSTIPTNSASGIPTGWNRSNICIRFTASEDNSSISYSLVGSPSITVSYSSDNCSTWNSLIDASVLLNAGESIYVKGTISAAPTTSDYGHFNITGKIGAYGSVMALQNENSEDTSINYNMEFYSLFEDCSGLTKAPSLPATTLTSGCYESMFYGCTSLTTAPELPSTTLMDYCYSNMFRDCISLTSAPELNATTLSDYCYCEMFHGCTSLTTAPSLPANTLVEGCYISMFAGCSLLNSVTIFAETWNTDYASNWLYGVADNGTIKNGGNATIPLNNYSGIPTGWTVISSQYTVNLNSQWVLDTTYNPDSSLYDGAYKSNSNKGVSSAMAKMHITIKGYTSFKLYIRSNAESTFDYVIVSPLDGPTPSSWTSSLYNNATYTYPNAYTRGRQTSDTSINGYTLVQFNNIDGGEHVIHITYGKDGSSDSGDDRGYVLIPKAQ